MPDPHAGAARGPVAPTQVAAVRLQPLAPGAARLSGGLWWQRAEVNGERSVPDGLARLGDAGNLTNLEIAAGITTGDAIGPIFADSDVHKWLEAASWEYARRPDDGLLADLERVTDVLAQAQEDDGYLDSVVQVRGLPRYADLPWSHEHYCAGHLFQAAVAQVRATGRRELLDVAVKLADHLVATFGEHGRRAVDGHPVVEMALVELYRETGTQAYLDLATFFVDARGQGLMKHNKVPSYFSDGVPVREARTVEGHAVRAVYLGAGAVDVAVETGDHELLKATMIQFDAMERSKQYITGGLGSRWDYEAFGDPYELPPDRAYAETCAAIGGAQWAWRLLLATGQARYADQMERMLLNGFLAGVSLGGAEYFYVNPLQHRTDAQADGNRSPAHGRRGWFDCACCPPNIMRTLSSLEGYLATSTDAGLQIHLYGEGRLQAETAGGQLAVRVETDYPWDGRVTIRVESAPASDAEIALRVPGWAEGATVDGEPVPAGEYARRTRTWRAGDEMALDLPMHPRLSVADERVDAVRGCVAIERGPLVYALEQCDQDPGADVEDLRIDPGALFETEHRPDLLGGVTVLRTGGVVEPGPDESAPSPYRRYRPDADPGQRRRVTLTAVPYFAWANRGPQAMRVWIPTM